MIFKEDLGLKGGELASKFLGNKKFVNLTSEQLKAIEELFGEKAKESEKT